MKLIFYNAFQPKSANSIKQNSSVNAPVVKSNLLQKSNLKIKLELPVFPQILINKETNRIPKIEKQSIDKILQLKEDFMTKLKTAEDEKLKNSSVIETSSVPVYRRNYSYFAVVQMPWQGSKS